MLEVSLLLQLAAASPDQHLREFIAEAAIANRAPAPELAGYRASVESEFAFILRDTIGREMVGQIEQLAARAEWHRDGRYGLHVLGYRAQTVGAPYSALTFTRTYTVPTLYGNRLAFGMNDGLPPRVDDARKRLERQRRDSAAGLPRYHSVHPLAEDRDLYYRFSGGDTVAILRSAERTIRLVRVHAEPVDIPERNFVGFRGELDFDADRHQLVRMRGAFVTVTPGHESLLMRAFGTVAVAYVDFQNAEVNGRYWLPAYQRSEFQAQLGALGEIRPVYRIVTRFRGYELDESRVGAVAVADSVDTLLPPVRASVTFAGGDSTSHYGEWQSNLGALSGGTHSDDFVDLAPDVWRRTGPPRLDFFPRRLEDVVRYNRVEGMFTGASAGLRFRDRAPGLAARVSVGWAWSEATPRGAASLTLARGSWISAARVERTLTSTNDFMPSLDRGLSLVPLFSGTDDHDYVDQRVAAVAVTRVLGNVDRALLTTELALVQDAPVSANVGHGPLHSRPFRDNRNAFAGQYARAAATVEVHPRVSGETLTPGIGARLRYESAAGQLDWQRVDVRLAVRQYWRGLVFASRVDAGAVFGGGEVIPPQVLYEMGGGQDLPSYGYKEFGGDRAALGRGLVAYYLPALRAPRRLGGLVIPGLSPGLGVGVQGGWTGVSSEAARAGLLALGGDGVTPLSAATARVRATVDFRLTFLSGAMGIGVARPVDQPGAWKPFFVWGAAF